MVFAHKENAVLKFRQASIHNPYLIKNKWKFTKTREMYETFDINKQCIVLQYTETIWFRNFIPKISLCDIKFNILKPSDSEISFLK